MGPNLNTLLSLGFTQPPNYIESQRSVSLIMFILYLISGLPMSLDLLLLFSLKLLNPKHEQKIS